MPTVVKAIGAAVGRGGVNLYRDVETVKYLLNTVPTASGGPIGVILATTPIDRLIEHIERFQMFQFGRADGRVEVESRTLVSLRNFDPTPGDPPFVPTRSPEE
jgi:hypothetical protein